MKLSRILVLAAATGALALAACDQKQETATGTSANQVAVTIKTINNSGVGAEIGTIMLSDTNNGLRLEPNLAGLTPGDHGIHFHDKPDCGPAIKDGQMTAGEAAGSHLDPANAGRHAGPNGDGHKGDLPVLSVATDGSAHDPSTAPHIKVADVLGHALVIHQDGDNYSDNPANGGGGARIACGVIGG